jgi:hypothetical protein
MAPASGAENFATTAQLLDSFCSWVHYYLLHPTSKGIKQLVTSCQETRWVSTNQAWSHHKLTVKCYYGFLPRAHFRDEKGKVARLFLQ